jgi:hypothetical protein
VRFIFKTENTKKAECFGTGGPFCKGNLFMGGFYDPPRHYIASVHQVSKVVIYTTHQT